LIDLTTLILFIEFEIEPSILMIDRSDNINNIAYRVWDQTFEPLNIGSMDTSTDGITLSFIIFIIIINNGSFCLQWKSCHHRPPRASVGRQMDVM